MSPLDDPDWPDGVVVLSRVRDHEVLTLTQELVEDLPVLDFMVQLPPFEPHGHDVDAPCTPDCPTGWLFSTQGA